MPAVDYRLLAIGLDPEDLKIVREMATPFSVDVIDSPDAFQTMLEGKPDEAISAVIAGPALGIEPQEMAQSISMFFLNIPAYFLTHERDKFERQGLKKQGFTDAFILPLDHEVASIAFNDLKAFLEGRKNYRPVSLVDVVPGSELPFDVSLFLPANQKYLKLVNAGEAIEKNQQEKLTSHNVRSVYVDRSQMPKFNEYTGSQLWKMNNPEQGESETQRREKMSGAVRDVLTNVFDNTTEGASIGAGKEIMEDAKQIVDSYIIASIGEGSWYDNLVKAMESSTDTYSHSSNVSTYAALFSMGAGVGDPAEMATAGIFHDLGLEDVPADVQKKKISEMSKDELELYAIHVDSSVKLMKEKKMIVPQSVINAIREHHEKFDGTGFPKGLVGPRITAEGQLLALADRFDYLTRIEPGSPRLTPKQALDEIWKEKIVGPDLFQGVKSLFPEVGEEKKAS
jgi:HD-GYP domain-containing protein (c-di-GMP phosphodiesterase class II)